MSGGLDSSYVTAVAATLVEGLVGYTLFVPGSAHLDERTYARHVAASAGIRLVEVDTTNCWYLSRRWLPDAVFDQPRVPGAGAALRAVTATAAAAGHKVLLGGEGGDEWIGGSWSGARYGGVTSALAAFRIPTAVRIAKASPRGTTTTRRIGGAVVEGFAPESWSGL